MGRTFIVFVVASLVIGPAWAVADDGGCVDRQLGDAALANHRECVSPNINCVNSGKCRNVAALDGVWHACYCLAPGATRGDEGGAHGKWKVYRASGTLAPHTTTAFVVDWDPSSMLDVFDAADIDNDGTVLTSQRFTAAGEFTGTFAIDIGTGSVDSLPVRFTQLNLTITPFEFNGTSTGVNALVLGIGASSVVGWFYPATGMIEFSSSIPCVLSNDQFLNGTAFFFRPILAPRSDGSYDLHSSGAFGSSTTAVANTPLDETHLQLLVRPNPSRGTLTFSVAMPPSTGIGELCVLDLASRVVFRRFCRFAGGHSEIRWDGRGGKGSLLPAGVYLAQLRVGDTATSARFALLR